MSSEVEFIVAAVVSAASEQTGIRTDVLRSGSRVPAVVQVRDLMMRILHTDLLCRLDDIGRLLGCDRASVSFAERRAEARMRADQALAALHAALVVGLKAAGVTPPPQRIGVCASWSQLKVSLTKGALHAIGVQMGDRVDAAPLDEHWRRLRVRRGERYLVLRVSTSMPGVALTLPRHLRGSDILSVPATWTPIVGGGIDLDLHRDLLDERERRDQEIFQDPVDTGVNWPSYAGHDSPRAIEQCEIDRRKTFGVIGG